MIRLIVFIAISLAGGLAVAQEKARVRAGEHATFSRIAIDLTDVTEWSLTQDGRKAVLRFPGRKVDFDTRQIFPGRRVTRILNARGENDESGAQLALTLSCACEVKGYRFGANMLVVDIREAVRSVEEAEAVATPETPPEPAEIADMQPGGSNPAEMPPGDAISLQEPTEAVAETEAPGMIEPSASDDPDDQAQMADAIAEAQSRLLAQLTRAAEQGLVEFRPPEKSDMEGMNASAPDDAVKAPEAMPEQEADEAMVSHGDAPPEASAKGDHRQIAPSPLTHEENQARLAEEPTEPVDEVTTSDARLTEPQLVARTVFDRARKTAPEPERPRVNCPPESSLDVENWATDSPLSEQIADLRRNLYAEFDRPSAEAALALARLYIRFGFGAEAMLQLRDVVADAAEVALLQDLANIVEGRPASPDGPVFAARDCEGAIAMWRSAARVTRGGAREDGDGAETHVDAIIKAYAETPLELRGLLGPALMEDLLDRNMPEAAERILLILDRAVGDRGAYADMAAARIAAVNGREKDSDAIFRKLIAKNAPNRAEAMILLGDSMIRRNAKPPAAFLTDVAATAFELRGAEIGRRLRVTEITTRAGAGGLKAAFRIIDGDLRRDPGSEPSLRQAARDILSRAASQEIDAVEYASVIADHLDIVGDDATADEVRISVAQEMTAIGLANMALTVLAPPLSRGSEAARLAGARAHLALSDGKSALEMLSEIESADAAELRARSQNLLGDYAAAFAALRADDNAPPESVAGFAWRAADWKTAATLSKDPVRKELAAFMAAEEQAIEPASSTDAEVPSLSAALALVETSREARTLLEKAMSDG